MDTIKMLQELEMLELIQMIEEKISTKISSFINKIRESREFIGGLPWDPIYQDQNSAIYARSVVDKLTEK
jgi:hypothetical protein